MLDKLSELKTRITEIEATLESAPLVELCRFETPTGPLIVWLTDRIRESCRRGRIWKSPAMLTALKNARYGLDRARARSRGGADGVFVLDRDFQPPNEMMRKLFDRFLDKPDPLVEVLVSRFGTPVETFVPVRVVSHHMRLLGVLVQDEEVSQLVIVDYDDT